MAKAATGVYTLNQLFTVQFLGSITLVEWKQQPSVRLEMGKSSHKLYEIQILHASRKNLGGIFDNLGNAIQRLLDIYNTTRPADQVPFLNASLVKDFLASKQAIETLKEVIAL